MEEKVYTISEDFVKAVQEVLATKPYLQVKDIINQMTTEMKESEINNVLNFVGQYPYKEVAPIFGAIQAHIKEKGAEVQTEPEAVVEDTQVENK